MIHGVALVLFHFRVSLCGRYDVELKKHELYVIEPSGVMYRYFGAAVGKGRQVRAMSCECLLDAMQ